MAVSYNKLWKLLVDKKMSKSDLHKKAEIWDLYDENRKLIGHRRTYTYGLSSDSRGKQLYDALMPRDALAFDMYDARRILMEDAEQYKAYRSYHIGYKKSKNPDAYFSRYESQIILYGGARRMLEQA